MANETVFYSWQSDLPNSINRGFIQNCLERALKELKSDKNLKLDPCLDRDTTGVPGSPDIAATIFEKIKSADIFVGDVTFIDADSRKRAPNPNVLVELGFAASCLGWDRIICVFNTSFGKVSDLPFDLRPRRIMTYELLAGEKKEEQRSKLVKNLRAAAASILHAPDREAQEALHSFLFLLASELIQVIIFGEEFDKRMDDPWLDSARAQFQASANSLRELALEDIGKESDLDVKLDALAELLDKVANLRLAIGLGSDLSLLVEQAVENAKSIKVDHIDSLPLSEDSVLEIHSSLESTRRKLTNLASRVEELVNQCRYDDVKDEASDLGRSILEVGYYNLDCIQTGLSAHLIDIGRDLHLLETMEVYMDGGQSEATIVDKIKTGSQQFSAVLDLLSKP